MSKTIKLSEMDIYLKVDLEDELGRDFQLLCAGTNGIYLKCRIAEGKIEYTQFESFDGMKEFIEDFRNSLVQAPLH